jgi:small subunit ribosomal protein S10e
MVAKKDDAKPKHDNVDVPNLEVTNLMKSLTSRGYVRENFSW